ncbi:MAG TPA: anhydro-N-acetylmuramic acid kinase [Steroidobacteraceae bacterium]|nr:anhydro-N-acetylmuramic acid kinase [Steroidobacteraceae bacterium]
MKKRNRRGASGSMWALGLMTGTVLDGMVDIAAVRTDGESVEELGPWRLIAYPAELRGLLGEALAAARAWGFAGPEPAIFRAAERALTRAQAQAVQSFLAEARLAPEEIGVVGFHGQTVLHRAPSRAGRGATRQLGDGAWLAELLDVTVAYDFRAADIAAGGHGAPLAPVYHAALLKRSGAAAAAAVLNLGGVANLTWWDGGDRLVACDTGPASAPLNDWAARHGRGEMDRDGALARQGRVDEARLAGILADPYFSAPYPKSLDRFAYPAALVEGLSAADGAATLTALVGAAVGKALDLMPQRPRALIVCGGGRKNPALIEALRTRARVEPRLAEELGWRGDAIEAECFAYLAVRALKDLPISFPLTTGVPHPLAGGRVAHPPAATSGR